MVIGRVIIRVTPIRALISLLITYLLSPLPLQVGFWVQDGSGFRVHKGTVFWRKVCICIAIGLQTCQVISGW